jgi:hypothetical protein
MSNALALTQILLQLAQQMQQIATLFNVASSEGRDVTDEEVDASGLKADVAIQKARGNVDG